MDIKEICIVVSIIFISLCPVFVNAEVKIDRVKLTPELVDSDNLDMTFGLKFDLNPDQNALMERENFTLDYILKGEWAYEEDVNTEPLEAKVNISSDWLTYMPEGDIYYYGQLEAGYESDDRFKEQEMDGSVTMAASYETSTTFKLDIMSHYSWVYSFKSEQRDRLEGRDTDDFSRLELETLAVLRLRKLIDTPIVRGLKLSGNYRYFNQHGLDRAVQVYGEDKFDYIKFDLAYEWWPSVFGMVQEAFISYSRGHLPTQMKDQSVWKAGVILYGAE